MYRNRGNLDLLVAGGIGLLGGAAYAAHAPGVFRVILGVALFFAPGYLWSEALLSQRLPAVERVMISLTMAFILPILGGFLLLALRISLFRPAWVAVLVVFTLLGVVAALIPRLRAGPPDPPDARPGRAARIKVPTTNVLVYGLAAVVALGSVAFSVRSAGDQKSAGYTILGLTKLADSPAKANLDVISHEGNPQLYELQLVERGTVIHTWTFTLSNGQAWDHVIGYTMLYSIKANLYKMPDVTTVYDWTGNGE
jgi:hypothetical protein